MGHDSLLFFSEQATLNVVCLEMPQFEHVTTVVTSSKIRDHPCRRKVTLIPLPLGCQERCARSNAFRIMQYAVVHEGYDYDATDHGSKDQNLNATDGALWCFTFFHNSWRPLGFTRGFPYDATVPCCCSEKAEDTRISMLV